MTLSTKSSSFYLLSRIVIGCLLLAACGEPKRVLTVEQVDELIRKQVHTGSTKAEVVAFLQALRIGSLEITYSNHFIVPINCFRHIISKKTPLLMRPRFFSYPMLLSPWTGFSR